MRDKKVHLIIDGTNFIYSKAPGFNEYFINLLSYFNESVNEYNLDITVYILKGQSEYFNQFNNFKVNELIFSNSALRFLWQNIILPFCGNKKSIFLFPANFAPYFFNKKYLLVIHDLNYLIFPNNFSFSHLVYRKVFIKKSLLNAHKIISISQFVSDEINKHFGINSVTIYNPLPSTINENRFSENFMSLNLNGKSYILVISSLSEHKNIYECVRACELVNIINPSLNFVFIGNWKVESFVEMFNPPSNVIPLGFVNLDLKQKLITNSAAMLVPSVYEGFGYPYFEAILNKKYLLCSDIPIVNEFFHCDNLIREPYKCTNIFNAINNFLKSEKKEVNYELKNIQKLTDSYIKNQYLKTLFL